MFQVADLDPLGKEEEDPEPGGNKNREREKDKENERVSPDKPLRALYGTPEPDESGGHTSDPEADEERRKDNDGHREEKAVKSGFLREGIEFQEKQEKNGHCRKDAADKKELLHCPKDMALVLVLSPKSVCIVWR